MPEDGNTPYFNSKEISKLLFKCNTTPNKTPNFLMEISRYKILMAW